MRVDLFGQLDIKVQDVVLFDQTYEIDRMS